MNFLAYLVLLGMLAGVGTFWAMEYVERHLPEPTAQEARP